MKKTKKGWRGKKNLSLLLFAVIVFVSILLRGAGNYLVVAPAENQSSDAAIILMGSIADRVLEAADYYKEGKTETIIIVNNVQYGSESLEPYGVFIPNFASLSVDALLQLGVPDSVIFLLPGRAKSTRDEADTLAAKLMTRNDIESLTIISSAAHTRRAKMIFSDSFKDHGIEVEIYSAPSRYSEFNAGKWWTDRESAKQVFMEWVKIISFVAVEKWL